MYGGHTIPFSAAHHVFAIVTTRANGASERYHLLELDNAGKIHIQHEMKEGLDEAKRCRLNNSEDCFRWQTNEVDPARRWSRLQRVINRYEGAPYRVSNRNCRHFVEDLQEALGIAKQW